MLIICNKLCSGCCTFFSAWAFIQLAILGYLFSIRSLNLFHSIMHDPEGITTKNIYEKAHKLYEDYSTISYLAAIIALVVFMLSLCQLLLNATPKTDLRVKLQKEELMRRKRIMKQLSYRYFQEATKKQPEKQKKVDFLDKKATPDTALKYVEI